MTSFVALYLCGTWSLSFWDIRRELCAERKILIQQSEDVRLDIKAQMLQDTLQPVQKLKDILLYT